MAVFRLPRFIGLGRAKRLILSGENITARQALDMGLVDYVFEPDEFAGKVQEVAHTFLKTASAGARQAKILTTQAFDDDHQTLIQRYFDAQIVATDSPDHAEAMAAYREGREPVYS